MHHESYLKQSTHFTNSHQPIFFFFVFLPPGETPLPIRSTASRDKSMENSQRNSSTSDAPTVPYASAKSFLAGALSGAIAKTAVAPFDRFVNGKKKQNVGLYACYLTIFSKKI